MTTEPDHDHFDDSADPLETEGVALPWDGIAPSLDPYGQILQPLDQAGELPAIAMADDDIETAADMPAVVLHARVDQVMGEYDDDAQEPLEPEWAAEPSTSFRPVTAELPVDAQVNRAQNKKPVDMAGHARQLKMDIASVLSDAAAQVSLDASRPAMMASSFGSAKSVKAKRGHEIAKLMADANHVGKVAERDVVSGSSSSVAIAPSVTPVAEDAARQDQTDNAQDVTSLPMGQAATHEGNIPATSIAESPLDKAQTEGQNTRTVEVGSGNRGLMLVTANAPLAGAMSLIAGAVAVERSAPAEEAEQHSQSLPQMQPIEAAGQADLSEVPAGESAAASIDSTVDADDAVPAMAEVAPLQDQAIAEVSIAATALVTAEPINMADQAEVGVDAAADESVVVEMNAADAEETSVMQTAVAGEMSEISTPEEYVAGEMAGDDQAMEEATTDEPVLVTGEVEEAVAAEDVVQVEMNASADDQAMEEATTDEPVLVTGEVEEAVAAEEVAQVEMNTSADDQVTLTEEMEVVGAVAHADAVETDAVESWQSAVPAMALAAEDSATTDETDDMLGAAVTSDHEPVRISAAAPKWAEAVDDIQQVDGTPFEADVLQAEAEPQADEEVVTLETDYRQARQEEVDPEDEQEFVEEFFTPDEEEGELVGAGVGYDEDSDPDRTVSGIWTIPLLCAGMALIACTLLIPAADNNRRMAYQRERLRLDLDQIQRQITVNDTFLNDLKNDATLAQRIAQRQMRVVPAGMEVIPTSSLSGAEQIRSPFAMVTVPPAAALPPYRPVGGLLANLCRDPKQQVWLIGSGLMAVAVGLVCGSSTPAAKKEDEPAAEDSGSDEMTV